MGMDGAEDWKFTRGQRLTLQNIVQMSLDHFALHNLYAFLLGISLALFLGVSSDGRISFAILLVSNYTKTNKYLHTPR
jgi:hypothetical protein